MGMEDGGKSRRAAAAAATVVRARENSFLDTMRSKAGGYAALGLQTTARFLADKAAALSSGAADDTLFLARVHVAAGHHRRALHLLTSTGLEASSLSARLLAAQCALAVNDVDGALAILGEEESDPPKNLGNGENDPPVFRRGGGKVVHPGGDPAFGKPDGPTSASADTPEIRAALCVMRGRVYELLENTDRATWWYKRALVWDLYCYEAFTSLSDSGLLSLDESAAFAEELMAGRGPSTQLWNLSAVYESSPGPASPRSPPPSTTGARMSHRRGAAGSSPTRHPPVAHYGLHSEARSWICAFYRVQVDRSGALPPGPVNANLASFREDSARATSPAEMLVSNKRMRDNLDVLIVRAMRLFAALDFEECARLTRLILDRDPFVEERVTTTHLAALVELDLRHELFVLAHSLVDNSPRDAVSWMAVGYYYFACGKHSIARRYLQKATAIDSRLGQAWIAFGHAFAAEDESDQAMAAYRTASRLFPGAQLPLLYMGMEYTRQSSLVHAASYFQSAREACPSDPAPRHELGVIAYRSGDLQGAVAYFKASISLWESSDGSKGFVVRGGRRAEAQEATMFNLGHCYRRLREFERAKECYQRSLSLQPRSASTCSALGMTLHALVDCATAVAMYNRSFRFNPEYAISVACLDRALNDMTAGK